jgi:hypothetical protein
LFTHIAVAAPRTKPHTRLCNISPLYATCGGGGGREGVWNPYTNNKKVIESVDRTCEINIGIFLIYHIVLYLRIFILPVFFLVKLSSLVTQGILDVL